MWPDTPAEWTFAVGVLAVAVALFMSLWRGGKS